MTLFVDAYQLAVSDNVYKIGWDEDQFTAHLCGYLNQLKVKGQWFVSPQQPYYTENHYSGIEHASVAPRPDIRFEKYIWQNESPFEFTIEAKNLKSNDSHLKARYIDTGIENFRNKRYPDGCLAGYVIQGTADECATAINSLLRKRKRASEGLIKTNFIRGFESSYLSTHISGNAPMSLRHIFLEFYIN
ncbi:hypothetical protein N2K84_06675 [Prolixibacteraceae bacterium A06]|uniref:Uncharacterized protein n=2 Tax=Gaoshiqia sediminis TaxID=2986998 RepID=A0AA41Y793_9BACT|nr:hypothetical protein [Gaoshiqia sediminis]